MTTQIEPVSRFSRPRRTQTLAQLAAAVGGFVVLVLLLESGGLVSWADRLELGPLRSAAVPVTHGIDAVMKPLGFDRLRTVALANLDAVGWPGLPAAGGVEAKGDTPADPKVANPGAGAATGDTMHPLPPAPASTLKTSTLPPLPAATALPPLPALAPGSKRTVALAGDSMMVVGIAATLQRQAVAHRALNVIRAAQSGTGLARPEVFDWQQEYPRMLAGREPDVVLVAIGANDAQGYVVDGKTLPFGTDEWIAVYEQRVTQYLTMLTRTGATVLWIGLPPMRSAVYNQHIAVINRIDSAIVQRFPRAVWFDPAPYVADAAGNFREFGPSGDDANARLRAADGIHLSDAGAALFTPQLMSWLDDPAQPPPVPTPPSPPAPLPAAVPKPTP